MLLLRLLAAALLLAFLLVIVYVIYQDVLMTRRFLAGREQQQGALRVINSNGDGAADTGAIFPLMPLTSVGRAPGNTIVLSDDYVSNQHALFSLRGQQWWLEDLNSRNGTLLNGVNLEGPTIVSAGDVITIGNTELKLEPIT